MLLYERQSGLKPGEKKNRRVLFFRARVWLATEEKPWFRIFHILPVHTSDPPRLTGLERTVPH